MLFYLFHLLNLLAMEHVKSAIVEYFYPKKALFELTLGIDSVFFGLLGDDLEVFIEDAIAVNHTFVHVQGLDNEALQLGLLFAMLIIHKLLLGFVHGLAVPHFLRVHIIELIDVGLKNLL